MQAWDQSQSRVSLAGALILVLILSAVILNRSWPLFWLLPALIAGAAFYGVNMRRYLRRKRWAGKPFSPAWLLVLTRKVTYYRNLSEPEKRRFEEQALFFLKENRITGIGTEINDEIRLLVASSAVILLFGRTEWEYPHLPEILIYPGPFDEEYQFERGSKKRVLAGVVVPQNAIVLSLDQLVRAFEEPSEAYHVGLHEFAHALDLADGSIDGIPRDVDPRMVEQWHDLIKDELARVRRRRSVLNPYAGENAAELFAVAVEHFFQRPRELKTQHPELYSALASFFNQYLEEIQPSLLTNNRQDAKNAKK